MADIGFVTLGCKVNIYESNALKNKFIDAGFTCGDPSIDSKAVIINTCSVTNQADAKSRRLINRAKRTSPNAIICVMGCYSQTNKEALEISGIDIILGNGNKHLAYDLIIKHLNNKDLPKDNKIIDILSMHDYEPLEVTIYDHTRAFIKIEDGCNNFCSYCIIPFARGPIRCKDHKSVLAEIKRVVDMGYEEVVLAGIHTGKYYDNGVNLSDLIELILKEVPLLKVLRLSSIEINEIDDKLLELLKNNKVLASHFHLPLQSGSDTVLKDMGRRYDTLFFKEKIAKIRSIREDISITTDVIVGYPTETPELFKESFDFIKEINFSKIHVFPFSMRNGTKASLLKDLPASIKQTRVNELITLSDKLSYEYSMKFIGATLEMIIECKHEGNFMMGHTSNYLDVLVPFDSKLIGKSVYVSIEKIVDNAIYGRLIDNFEKN